MRSGAARRTSPLRVPSASGSASRSGVCSTSASGANPSARSPARSMNIVFANSAWYGCAVTTRTADRCSGSAPAQASTTYSVSALAEMLGDLVAQPGEVLLGQRRVDLAPPDPAFGSRLAHDELVLRRPPGVHARCRPPAAHPRPAARRRAEERAYTAKPSSGCGTPAPRRRLPCAVKIQADRRAPSPSCGGMVLSFGSEVRWFDDGR